MAVRLMIATEAEQDINEAYDWYECRRVGLGEDFLSSVDACIRAICRWPKMCERVYEDYRRGLVRRFPYAVFYAHANGVVTVYCIFHTSRDPRKWRERLP